MNLVLATGLSTSMSPTDKVTPSITLNEIGTASPCMMAEDGGLGMMPPAMALMSMSLIGGMVSDIMRLAALSTHDISALGTPLIRNRLLVLCSAYAAS